MSITRSSPVQVAAFSTTYSQAPKLVSTSWSKVSVGPSHVLAIKSNNTLWAWGFNNLGQLGDSTTISRSSPVQIGNPSVYTWNDIIAGLNFSVGLRGDNLLFTWGLNSTGQLGDLNAGTTNRSSPIQIGTSSWTAISAGGSHVVAIRSDKSLWAWGLNTSGQLGNGDYFTRSSPVQVSSSSWSIISAGQTHTTAITTDGKLYTWGDNTAGTLGYTTPTQNYYSWTSVSGNADYTIAIRNDGLLFAWGLNNFGQLGDFTTINRSSPVQIGTSSWSVVSANAPTGGGPTLAIRSDGTLWGWGYNATGVLGLNDVANRSSPVQVSGGGSWSAVASSKSHTLAIKSTDGLLYAWGLNTSGQLGTFDAISRSSPVQVSGSATASFLTFNSATAVDNSGNNVAITVASGSPTIGNSVIPFSNTYSANFTSNAYYQANFPALGTQWTFEFWVYVTTVPPGNWYWYIGSGQGPLFYFVGNSTSITGLGKVNQGGGSNFSGSASLAANTWAHIAYTRNASNLITIWFNGTSVATTTDGTSFGGSSSQIGYPSGGNGGSAAGYISNFRLINNYCAYTASFTRPTTASPATISLYGTITPSAGIAKISAGDISSYVIKSDNQLYAWGVGTDGRLGLGDTAARSSPTQISSKSWTSVYAYGSAWVHAIDSNNKLFAWGLGVSGQLGYNDSVSRSSPVQINSGNWSALGAWASGSNSYGIQTDGSLWAWGGKNIGLLSEFGNANFTYSWSQVSAGPSHSGAVRSDGRLYTWGLNSSGQLGNSTTVNTSSPVLITTISSGDRPYEFWNRVSVNGSRTVAVRNDGTLWTWGSNVGYLLGTGDSVNRSRPVQIANSITTEVSNSNIWSTYFNGASDYITFPDNAALELGANNFTIECWVYSISSATQQTIVNKTATGSVVGSYDLRINTNGTIQYFASNTSGATWTINAATTGTVNFNNWNHIAYVRNTGGVFTVYINGISAGTTTNNITLVNEATTTNIGATGDGLSTRFIGYITNLRITTGQALYTGTFTPSTAPLTTSSVGSTGSGAAASLTGTVALLTCQNFSVVDNSSNGFIATKFGELNPGQPSTPFTSYISATRSWTGVSAGLSHTVAVNSLGRMYVWGDNTYQQLGQGSTVTTFSSPVQVGSSSWSQVSSYGTHSLAIDVNNKLYSWGDNTLGQVGVNSSPLQWTTVNSYYTTQIIRNDGVVYVTGWNNGGQLGDGTVVSRSSPVQLSGGGSWSQIVSGYNGTNFGYSIGIKTDGTLYTWGLNSSGILGDSTLATSATRSSPVQVGTSSWLSVSTMNNSAIAICSDYTMWAWGKNDQGQLGDGTTVSKSAPVQIGSSSWIQVSVGASSAVAVKLNNTLYTWGLNANGQIGDGTTISKSSPVQIGSGSWIQASTKNLSTFAIFSDYTLWAWGDNSSGKLGVNDVSWRSSPVQVNSGFYFDSVSAGFDHAIAKRRDGTIVTWGLNDVGQLGLLDGIGRSSPVQIGTSSWVSISAGYRAGFGITTSGGVNGLQNLYVWGVNDWGALGINNSGVSGRRSSPTQVATEQLIQSVSSPTQIGTDSWTSISAGLSNSFAIRSNYKLFTWGDNSQLQSGYITPATALGTASNTNNNAQSYIRSTDNALLIWGANDAGQLGDNTIINRSSPVQLGLGFGASQYKKIARAKVATAGYTLGIQTDGSLWSWGSDAGGQLGIGLTTNRSSPVQVGTLTNWSDVAAGPSHALAIKSDGSLWGWGINGNGQIGDNTTVNRSSPVQIGTSSWTAVSAGTNFSTAIRIDGGLFTWGFGTQGQLGSGLTTARSNPVQVGTESYTSISSGGSHTVALRTDLTLYAWGLNNAGQLGDNSTTNRSSPVQVNTGLVTSWNFISAGVSHTSAIDATNNLPYGWGLNSSGQIGDNTLVNKSAPVQVSTSSVQNYSYQFNGTNYLTIPVTSQFAFGTGDFTIECWVNTSNYNIDALGGEILVDNWINAGGSYQTGQWQFWLNSSGLLQFGYATSASAYSLIGTGTVSLNTWTHCAVTRSGNTVTVYINGVASGSASVTQNIGVNNSASIGRQASNSLWRYTGYISNVRVVKGTALYTTGFYPSAGALTTSSQGATPGQVSLLTAQSATIVDNSTNAFAITNTGTVAAASTNPFGPYYSGSFNGSGTQLTLPSIPIAVSEDFTIECWIYPTHTPSALRADDKGIYTFGGNASFRWGISGAGPNPSLVLIPSATSFVISDAVIQMNNWQHIALVRYNNTITQYFNGIPRGTYVYNSSITSTTAKIGSWNSSNPFQGYISNFRFVRSAVYVGIFTVPNNILRIIQSAMTNILALTGTETVVLTLQNSNIVDNSTNNSTITNSGPVVITTAYAPFSASSIAGNSSVWDSIQAGITSTMGTSNNTLFTWGAGTTGQLGDNTVIGKSAPSATGVGSIWSVTEKLFSSPVQVGTAKSWSLIGAGAGHTVAMATDYSIWAWGQNTAGQLGDSTTVGKSSPTQIAGNTSSYTFITAGVSDTFAIRTTTNLLFAWGLNTGGILGLNDTANRSSPVQVFAGNTATPQIPIKLNTVSGSSFTIVQAGTNSVDAISSSGLLYTWGDNSNGLLALNAATTATRSSPVQVGGLQFTYINSPTQVGSSSYSQVSAGYSHTLAIDTNSLLYAWGKTPANGQSVNRSSPVQIGSNSWLYVSAGVDASQAIDSTRTLYAWGLNTNYQLGSASFSLNQSVTSPVAIGTLAINNANRTNSAGSGNGGFIKNI